MIEINLLPLDRRPVEKTPLPRFILLVAGVAVVCVELMLAVLFVAIKIPGDSQRLEQLKEGCRQREKEAKKADELETEIAEIEARRKAVEALYDPGRLVRWSPILDQLDEEEVRPEQVWLRKFEVKTSAGEGPATATLNGFVRGSGQDMRAKLAQFVVNLNANEQVSQRFERIVPVKFTMDALRPPEETKTSPRAIPAEALSFELELTMRQPKPATPPPRPVGTPK